MAAKFVAAAATLLLSSQWTESFTSTAPTSSRTKLHHVNVNNAQPAFQTRRNNIFQTTMQGAETLTTENTNGDAKSSSAAGRPRLDSCSSSEEEEAGFMWTKQWYPILPESYLLDQKPTAITILGQDLVIWKTSEGGVSVMEDSCPHRRAPLSTGKIVGDQLACRFHGWEFDSAGSCKSIPMDPSQKYADKFCVKAYHAQLQGGLLWAFMDPTVTSPPPIPRDIVNKEANALGWNMYSSPTSFLSQIENSFDPTHAPFTHENSIAFGSSVFSPENAVPMERYDLIEPLSISGFGLEHSPYQKTPPGVPETSTTRQYVAPCTSVVKSPFFSASLHFVPSKPGETLVVAQFGGGGRNKKEGVLQRLLPRRLKTAMKDFTHFGSELSNFRYQFFTQDRLTMQGQDSRKVKDGKWDDMTPTPSDAGVKAMQRWMRRYGGFGPFPFADLSAHQGKELSMWESHGQYCPQCQATMKRLVRVEKVLHKISAIFIGTSLLGAAVSSLFLAVQKHTRASAGVLVPTVASLVLSVGARALSQYCSNLMQKAFVTRENDARLRTLEIYAE